MLKIDKLITPGDYKPGEKCDTDSRRCEFDIKNEQIFYADIKPDIIFAGDSITHFFEECRFYHKYGYVVNRGIGGDMAHTMAWRFTADVTQLQPKLCIMLVGCNNMWELENHIDTEKDDYEEEWQLRVLKEIEDAFRKMLDEAKDNGFTMWICSELPQGGDIPNIKMRNPFIVRTNKMLKSLADEYGTEYIDYHSSLTKEDGLTLIDGHSREGIHPNHAGYEVMRQVIEPKLKEFFNK